MLIADAGFGDYAPILSSPSYDSLLSDLDSEGAFGSRAPFRHAYDFEPGTDPADNERPFAVALSAGNCALILEEADRFDLASSEHYRECVYRGRHYGVSIVALSLTPKDLPTDLRRQATRIISFRQVMPADLDWLSEVMGEKAYELAALPGPPSPPPHPALCWEPQRGVYPLDKAPTL